MNEQFSANLEGSALFKKIIAFLLAYVVCLISAMYMAAEYVMTGYFISILLAMVSGLFLEFKVMEYVINSVALGDKRFSFMGSFGTFVGMVVKGSLLSCITFGIYFPWFLRNIIAFFTDNTEFPEKNISFESTGGKLLKYMFLSFIIPLIILIVILALAFNMGNPEALGETSNMVGFMVVYMAGVVVIASLMLFFLYRWYINFIFGNETVKFAATFGETVLFFVVQYILTFITLGIYAFAFEVKLIKFLTEKTEVVDMTTGTERFPVFSGGIGEGFLLFLGQGLLSLITLGIYAPWAIAKVGNWVINNIEVTDNQLA